MSQVTEVRVPDIGDFKNVPIIDIAVNVGDSVNPEDPLITLESDKAAMDVPSPATGIVKSIAVKVGDNVSEGSLILILETGTVQAKTEQAVQAADISAKPDSAPAAVPAASVSKTNTTPYASPSVRRFAREYNIDLSKVAGSARGGRITQEDAERYLKGIQQPDAAAPSPAALPTVTPAAAPSAAAKAKDTDKSAGLDLLPWPSVDFSKFGPTTTAPLSRIKKISGANLHRNWVMIPHVTQFDEADVTSLEAFRKELNTAHAKQGVKLTMLAFLVKACVAALQKFPTFNSSLDNDQLVLKQYYNIGFAADTPNGLVVPVIKNADRKGVFEIAREMGTLASLAREGKLKAADMQGGTFTISSLGGIGGTAFTPIINAPEVAILGVSRTRTQPVWNGETFEPRLVLPLSLSYDHRVIDGAEGARFTAFLVNALHDIRRALL